MIFDLLEELPQLLELSVLKLSIDDAALEPLSSMQHLQSCRISCPDVTPAVLSSLCSNLTSLEFTPEFPKHGEPFLQEDLPEGGWPLLRVFRMYHTPLQPAVLTGFTDLEVLDLWECSLLPTEEVGGAVGQGVNGLAGPMLM